MWSRHLSAFATLLPPLELATTTTRPTTTTSASSSSSSSTSKSSFRIPLETAGRICLRFIERFLVVVADSRTIFELFSGILIVVVITGRASLSIFAQHFIF